MENSLLVSNCVRTPGRFLPREYMGVVSYPGALEFRNTYRTFECLHLNAVPIQDLTESVDDRRNVYGIEQSGKTELA